MFLERTFTEPMTGVDVDAMETGAVECFELHRVDWRQSFLSLDGRHMVCWFTAPDAESVRIALRQAGADIRVLWSGTVHDAPMAVDANVVVERSFDEPVTLEAIQSIEDAGAWCLEAYRVSFARTLFSREGTRMLCLYRAPDAESVRLAQLRATVPFDRVWGFRSVRPRMAAPAV